MAWHMTGTSSFSNQKIMFMYYISSITSVYLVSLPVHGCFGLPDDEEDPKKPEIDWCKRSKWGRKEMMHFFLLLALRVSTSIQKPTFHTPLISMTINRLLFLASYLFLVRNSSPSLSTYWKNSVKKRVDLDINEYIILYSIQAGKNVYYLLLFRSLLCKIWFKNFPVLVADKVRTWQQQTW